MTVETPEAAVSPRIRLARLDAVEIGAALALLAFVGIIYNPYSIFGDDPVTFYGFLDHIFGGHAAVPVFDPKHAVVGYYFGLAFLNAPFYALGLLIKAAGIGHVSNATPMAAAVSAAGTFYMVAAAAVVAYLLRLLRMPFAGVAALLAVVGSPLLYYGVFQPGKAHAASAFVFALAIVVLVFLYRRPERWLPLSVALGATLGLATATRYEIAGAIAGLMIALTFYRRPIHALVVGVSSVVTFLLLAILPLAEHAPLFQRGAAHGTSLTLGVAPLTPLRLLFSGDRGIALWSPVMVLGAIGFVRLVVVSRQERPLLVQIGAMHLGLFCFFFFVTEWVAGWSFSTRYFTPLVPAVAIGISELVRWRPRVMSVAAVACATWSLYLCLNEGVGVTPFEERAAAWHIAAVTARRHMTLNGYLYALYGGSHLHKIFG